MLELGELERRERLAKRAILQAKADKTRQEYEQAKAESARLRREADAATKAHLSSINRGRVPEAIRGDRPKAILYRGKLGSKKAMAWARAAAAKGEADRARDQWRAAREELDQGTAA